MADGIEALRERVASLSQDRRQALARALVRASEVRGQPQLVAYVAPADDAPSVEDLTAFLGERLPVHMIPDRYVVLDSLPRTSSGKLDRRGLSAVQDEALDPQTSESKGPRNEAERVLAEIWMAVLDTDEVDIHDDFFELGGDSILSIRLISRANQAGLKITPQQFFASPTVADLAAAAQESEN